MRGVYALFLPLTNNFMATPKPAKRRTAPTKTAAGIVGIDPSLTGTGLFFTSDGMTHKISPPKDMASNPIQRLSWLRTSLHHELVRHQTTKLAVIEGYSMGSKFQREALGEWGGVLRLVLLNLGFQKIAVVAPTTLKKFVIGHAKKGQSGKDVMLLKTFQRWGVEFSDHDLSDAFCLAKAGEVLFNGEGTKTDLLNLKSAKVFDLR